MVSDLVADLWASILRRRGTEAFAEQAMAQLIRWDQKYGWTRGGYGAIAEQELPLATVAARLLPTPGAWITCADAYLAQLDRLVTPSAAPGRQSSRRGVLIAENPAAHAAQIRLITRALRPREQMYFVRRRSEGTGPLSVPCCCPVDALLHAAVGPQGEIIDNPVVNRFRPTENQDGPAF